MKILDIPALLAAVVNVYGVRVGHALPSPCEQMAAVLRGVLTVHRHDVYRWDPVNAKAVPVEADELRLAEFAICASCGRIEREFFWCPTVRQMFAELCELDELSELPPSGWPDSNDLAEAVERARAAYPTPVATAVIRSLTEAGFAGEYRTELLDAVLATTPSVPAQVIAIDRAASRGRA